MYAVETGGSYKTSAISSKQSGYLSKGSRGEDVKAVQQVLNKLGYSTGGVDGIFGKNTDAAIKAFQKANGLTPDGIIGPKTLQALTKAANSISSASGTPKSNITSSSVKPVTLSSGSTTPVQQKSSSTYQISQNTSNTKTAGTSYVTQTSTNKSYGGSTTPVPSNSVTTSAVVSNKTYPNSASTTPALNGSSTASTTPSPAKNNAAITAYTSSSKSGSTTPVQTNGSPYPSYLKSASTTPYISASTAPVIYNKNGSTTPIAGGSTAPKLNIIAGQINGSTTPQNYKIYDKSGQITTNQQNVNTGTVLKNFGEGIGDAVFDTLKGVWTIATHPAETAKGIAYTVTHPAEAANAIKKEVIKTYNDFKAGDANTKAKISGRIVGEIGLAVVGTKRIDKGVKIVKEATVIAGTAKAAEAVSDVANAEKAVGVAEKAGVTAVKEITTQTVEKTTFKEIKEVTKVLKESGVDNPKVRRNIIETFNPGAKVVEVDKDFKAFRYYGGESEPRGQWVTDRLLKDPENELALPPVNKAEKVQEWIVPKGTKVLDGTVAPHEKWGRPGRARQIFVPNPEILKEGKNTWYLKGTSYTK